MFAFAIWDQREQQLFLARDRLGVKPLYYTHTGDRLLFASEIKALLAHPQVHADLDEDAFANYLTFVCTPAPATLFKGISKLEPAQRMVVNTEGRISLSTYWNPFNASVLDETRAMSTADIDERLGGTVNKFGSKENDVRCSVRCLLLSGGVDSSTNVALMDELHDQPVRTFSIGFQTHQQYNELDYARRVAKQFNTDHHEVLIDVDDLTSFLPDLIHHQDEPIADWVCVPLHYVAKLARDSGTIVVQIGEGADELFLLLLELH